MEPIEEMLRRELVEKTLEDAIEMAKRYDHNIAIVEADGEDLQLQAKHLIAATIYVATKKGKVSRVVWIEGD